MPITKTYPYTFDQLRHFRDEMKEAGGIDELMIQKRALRRDGKSTRILTQKNIDAYKRKYLTGVYESFRNNYQTEVPYVFWSKLYELVQRYEGKEI